MAASRKSPKRKSPVIEDAVRQKIEALSLEFPEYGARRLLPLLKKEQIQISETSVYDILRQRGLQNRVKRLSRLEERYINENIALNDQQRQALESYNPCLRERHNYPSQPGRLLFQDTRRVLAKDELGTVFLHATVDAHCLLAFGCLSFESADPAPTEFLQTHVLPFYEQHRVMIHTVLTLFEPSGDPGEAARPAQPLLGTDGAPEGYDHRPAAGPNGFVDYFFQAAEAEFFKNYAPEDGRWALVTLQADYDRWLDHYNYDRLHQGFPSMGAAPFTVFVNAVNTSGVWSTDISPLLETEEAPAPTGDTPSTDERTSVQDVRAPLKPPQSEPTVQSPRQAPASEAGPVVEPPKPIELTAARRPVRHHAGRLLVYGANAVLILLIIWFGVSGFIKIQGNAGDYPVQTNPVYSTSKADDQKPASVAGSNSYRRIWQRDLFQTQSDKADGQQVEARMLSNLPKATDTELSLIGTVVFSQPERNYAIVYDGKSDNQLLLHAGDRAGNVRFKRILRNKVIIDSGSGEQLLAMEEKASDSAPPEKEFDNKLPARSVRKVPTSLRRKYLQNRLRRIYRSKQRAADRE